MIEHKPLLHCDWLQLNLQAPRDLEVKYQGFYTVKLMPYSTRHFKIVEEIYKDGMRIATVTRVPLSNVLEPDTILIKFDNWLLYSYNIYHYITRFIALNGFKFKSISRLDLCIDFQCLANNMIPSTFIKNYMFEKYLRLGRTTIGNSHFQQIGTGLSHNSLKFGSNTSDVSVQLYNKTLEMTKMTWKPWIAESWLKAGFNMDADTWRLEVSIKGSNKIIVNTDSGEIQVLNSLDILNENYMKLSFNVFREKYFSFVIKDSQKKKNRMKLLPIFNGNYSKYAIVDGESMISANRADKIFIKKLEEVNNDLRGKNFDFNINISKLKEDYIAVCGLQSWAIFKGLL